MKLNTSQEIIISNIITLMDLKYTHDACRIKIKMHSVKHDLRE